MPYVLDLSDNTGLQPPEDQFPVLAQTWAPQGNSLAISYAQGPISLAIYEIDGAEINPQAVDSMSAMSGTVFCDLAWSPSGDSILAVQAPIAANVCQGSLLLYSVNLTYHRVLPLPGLVSYPRWSRDGSWVSYGREDTLHVLQYRLNVQKQASGEVWIAKSTTFDARPLLTGPAYNGQAVWRPLCPLPALAGR